MAAKDEKKSNLKGNMITIFRRQNEIIIQPIKKTGITTQIKVSRENGEINERSI